MEKRLPHITAEMEHQSFRARRRGDFPGTGLQSSGGNTYSLTVEAQRLRQEEEARKHREELAQIGPNVIG